MVVSINMSASAILGAKNPEQLFNEATIHDEYRALARKWHPDICKIDNANEIFVKINTLYDCGKEKIKNKKWNILQNTILLESILGNTYKVTYIQKRIFELGEEYILSDRIIYVIDKSNSDLFNNALSSIQSFTYADSKMRSIISPVVPEIMKILKLKNGNSVLIIKKPTDVYPLSNVMDALGGKIDVVHAAWIMSRLHMITAFLELNSISHNGITIDSLFISPKNHTVCLFGNWWYSKRFGTKLIAVPSQFSTLVPKNKNADNSIDLISIKKIVLNVMGYRSIGMLNNPANKYKVPEAFKNWLQVLTKNAIKGFNDWDDILINSFGERKFVVMNVDTAKIYKKEGE